MKFREKLIKLRKQKAYSQEDLAAELNVTRQTISNWELGLSKPDMEKLVEISRIFNVGVEELTNDNKEIGGNKMEGNSEPNTNLRNGLIIVAIIVAIFVIAGFIWKIVAFNSAKKMLGINGDVNANTVMDTFFGITDKAMDRIQNITDKMDAEYNEKLEQQQQTRQNKINEEEEKMEERTQEATDMINQMWNNNSGESTSSFNGTYEHLYTGVENKFSTQNAIKRVIQDNLNKDRKISIKYKDTIYKESKELNDLSKSLNNDEYLLSYEKDADGYIYQMNIEDM